MKSCGLNTGVGKGLGIGTTATGDGCGVGTGVGVAVGLGNGDGSGEGCGGMGVGVASGVGCGVGRGLGGLPPPHLNPKDTASRTIKRIRLICFQEVGFMLLTNTPGFGRLTVIHRRLVLCIHLPEFFS